MAALLCPAVLEKHVWADRKDTVWLSFQNALPLTKEALFHPTCSRGSSFTKIHKIPNRCKLNCSKCDLCEVQQTSQDFSTRIPVNDHQWLSSVSSQDIGRQAGHRTKEGHQGLGSGTQIPQLFIFRSLAHSGLWQLPQQKRTPFQAATTLRTMRETPLKADSDFSHRLLIWLRLHYFIVLIADCCSLTFLFSLWRLALQLKKIRIIT